MAEWTKIPPGEGWFWSREASPTGNKTPIATWLWLKHGRLYAQANPIQHRRPSPSHQADAIGLEYWPIPIQPPAPREADDAR